MPSSNPDSNTAQLISAAQRLRPLLEELVFVGGSVTTLLITDTASGAPRATLDVDAIAAIASYADYARFGDRLRALGFTEDTTDGAPLCRWICETTILDVMPISPAILGFSNPWYVPAMETAAIVKLTENLEIKVVTAPFFLATKLAAFKGRGGGDFFGSRDLEDLISIIDGRATLAAELIAESTELRAYVATEVSALLSDATFLDALPGFLLPDAASQSRIGLVIRRLEELASMART